MVVDNLAISNINQHVGRSRRNFRRDVAEELVQSSIYESLKAVDGLRRNLGKVREIDPVRPVDDPLAEILTTIIPFNGEWRGRSNTPT